MSSIQSPHPVWAGRALALIAIILVAVNLRTAVTALSPIFDDIRADVPLSNVGIGLLGTLPPLCFAIFGLLTPLLRRRMHLETLLVISLLLMTVTHLWRAASGTYLSLALASVLAFAAVGVANVVLPPIVKKYFPDRIGGVTSVYVTVMTFFSMVPALVAVPVAQSAGWRASVGMWAALGLVAGIPWLALWLRQRRARVAAELIERPDAALPLTGNVWRSRLAWALAVFFGMTSINVFGVFAWLPQMLTDIAPVTPGEAGGLLALYASMGVPLAIIVPVLAVRRGSTRPLIIVGVLLYLSGYVGLLMAPGQGTWLWIVLAGLGPMLFPLALVLINLRTRTHHGAITLSGFTQGMGYLIGALGPLLVGILHEVTGGWTAPIVFLLVTTVGTAVSGAVLLRPRMLEDEQPAVTLTATRAADYGGRMKLPVVFVHGSGASGAEAWPGFAGAPLGRGMQFIARPGAATGGTALAGFEADARAVIAAAGDGAHVVAHSYGALSAIRAAELSPATIASLILFEPSAFWLVRGNPDVEQLVESIADDTDGSQAWDRTLPPWDAALNPDVFAGVATLAVWGAENPAYQAVVDRLQELGAERAEIRGYGHDLTRAPEAVELVREFVERVESRSSG